MEKPEPVFTMRVYGTPQQRGSKSPFALKNRDGSPKRRANGSIVIVVPDDNKKSGDWMTEVRMTAGAIWRGELLAEPLVMEATFWFSRPKSHYGSGKNSDKLKPSAPSGTTRFRTYRNLSAVWKMACPKSCTWTIG
jgi:hypothetical protein